MVKPFSRSIALQISYISYFTLIVGLVSYSARHTAEILHHRGIDTGVLNAFWGDSQAYVLMAAVIYVIASIFTRGVELQNENDLTV